MTIIYAVPGNEKMLDEIYVVLSSDDKGEGICSMITVSGAMPMVFGHERLINGVKDTMKVIARESGQNLRLMKFKKSDLMFEVSGKK